MYRSPILIDAFFARPTALCAPQRVERSGQIEGTEATCSPRRPKGHVMVTQGREEHPAAASLRRILGKKYRTTGYAGNGEESTGLKSKVRFFFNHELTLTRHSTHDTRPTRHTPTHTRHRQGAVTQLTVHASLDT